MIEAKLALGAAITTFLLAVGTPTASELGEVVKLGLAGVAMGIVFRMATHTIPDLIKTNQALQLDLAKVNADAIKESAKINAEAIAGLGSELNEYANRMTDLLAQAIKCAPPKS